MKPLVSPVRSSSVRKRSVVIGGRRTSVSLEDAFWMALREIAVSQRARRTTLIAQIDGRREETNLSSAIRLFVLEFYRQRVWYHTLNATMAPPVAPATPQ
jgi:predicted DNA-binding ribbon-helix-helix protein